MTLTLLLDLDDTLLDNDQNAFFAAFASTLIASLARHGPADRLSKAMQRGMQAMFLNDDPGVTLSEAFYRQFLDEVPVADPLALRADVERYYREVYPALSAHTRPRDQAQELLDWAFSQGYRVAIATNPLFTTSAVEQRLAWGSLSPDKYPFALVTANETFHFVKSPAFYGEVMARLGWPDDPILMVGDDLHLDVLAAQTAGLPAFQVVDERADGSASVANGQGRLEDVRPWLQSTDPTQLTFSAGSTDSILATLRSTPAGLAGLVAGLPVEAWQGDPKGDEWGLTEICCHLRDVDAEVNLPRIRAMIQGDNPFIVAQDTNEWAGQRQYAHQDGRHALSVFSEHRRELIAALSSLPSEDWRRRGRHSIFGPTDLRELAGISAEHDRSHVRQAFEAIAKRAACQP